MGDRAGDVAARVWPGRSVSCEPLPGGITNSNFKVTVGGENGAAGTEVFVLRIAGEKTELLGIDRESELTAARLAAEAGVGADLHVCDRAEGVLVTTFIAGRPVPASELATEPALEAAAAALRRVHAAGAVRATFDPFGLVPSYLSLATARGSVPSGRTKEMAAVVARIGERRPHRPVALCHNDLLNSNLIWDGSLRIVDWEYAGMGDPFFDLGNFAVNHALPEAAEEGLLRHYFGEEAPWHLPTLKAFELVSEAREAAWGILQSVLSALDFDFVGYAREHEEGFFSLLERLDLDAVLELVELGAGP